MLFVGATHAADTEVTAELSRAQGAVGIPVELQVKVNGSVNAQVPQTVDVDGLLIAQRGKSTQVQMNNFQMSTSVVFSYRVLPMRAGSFEIPAITVQVDGKELTTQPLALEVVAGAGTGSPPTARAVPVPPTGRQGNATPPAGQAPTPDPNARLAYAELVIPRETVFVGEMVPVEIRFYFNKSRSFRLLQDQPTFSGEGFTVEDLTAPQRGEQVIGGTTYHVLSFQSAITAVKSGELEIPGVTMPTVMEVPTEMPGGFDGFFGQFFGNSGFSDSEQLNVTSDPARLTVRRLPKDGRPETFSGAIGDFTMTVDAEPKTAAPGDPVTMKVTIDGRGNFSAMGEPVLEGTDGWKLYPPTDRFEASDSVGFGGVKTYEFMVIAKTKQTQTPEVAFSYFDPTKEEYVTLSGGSIPVVAEASAAVAAATPQASAGPDPSDATDEEGKSAEVAGRTGVVEPGKTRSFRPAMQSIGFLVFNSLAFLAVAGLAGALIMRRVRSGEGARRAELRRRHRDLLERMRSKGLPEDTFFELVDEDLDVLVASKRVGTREDLVRTGDLSEESKANLDAIFSKIDERKFASGVVLEVNEAERNRMVSTLEELGGR